MAAIDIVGIRMFFDCNILPLLCPSQHKNCNNNMLTRRGGLEVMLS